MTVAPQISTLEFSGLIRLARANPELEYIFRHALVQDAAYDSLLKSDRRALHAAVAETLEGMYPGRLDEISATLADHHERAENFPQALRHYLSAARQSARTYANVEALGLFERAIEISALPEARANVDTLRDLYTQYGRVLELSGRHPDAIEAYRQMQAEAIRRRDRRMELDALIAQAVIYATPSSIHNTYQAEMLCEQALAIASALKNLEAESRIYWILLLVHYFGRNPQLSVSYGQKSLEIARAIHNRERIAFTLNDISRSYAAIGNQRQAAESLADARALWEEMGNLPMLADNLSTYAEGLFALGQFDDVLEAASRAYEISHKINNAWGQGYALSLIARARWNRGETNLALEKLSEIDTLFTNGQPPFVTIMTTAIKLDLYAEMGDFETATRHIDSVQDAFVQTGSTFDGFQEIARAYLAIAGQDFEQARQMLEIARVKVSSETFNSYAPLYRGLVEYRLALAENACEPAIEFFRGQIESLKAAQIESLQPIIYYWLGGLLDHVGKPEEAETCLTLGLDLARRFNIPRFLWKIYAGLAVIAARKADFALQAEYRAAARQQIEFVAQNAPPGLSASFLALPQVRAALEAG